MKQNKKKNPKEKRKMDYDMERVNKEKAIWTYKETEKTLKEYFNGEKDSNIKLNSQCVLDGLQKIIMLKERELKQYIRQDI